MNRKTRFYMLSFLKHDFKASITVFFVALPLCLGISLASNAPVYSGLIAGMIGGIFISLISKSPLSVSGPAAGLTAICASAIAELGTIDIFFLSVAIAGLLQMLLGIFKLGGFTHFIPSAVIKGMLAAIGLLLIIKQIPLLLGYDKPDFWTNALFNIVSLKHGFSNIGNLFHMVSAGAILVAAIAWIILALWNRFLAERIPFLPSSFVVVITGIAVAWVLPYVAPSLQLKATQFVNVPADIFSQISFPSFDAMFSRAEGAADVWRYGVIICFVASLETLLSIEAIDKLDPYNRITPQNRELIAQGAGNMLSGLVGGLPVTAVIVRSSANAEAGARTKLSAIAHGIWLLLAVVLGIAFLNRIPYAVLAVILIRTGYNLAKPGMVKAVYRQGREQFMPFAFTILAILFTDLLIGVMIGVVYAIFFLIKHTYRAGYTIETSTDDEQRKHYKIELALNVSFLNKKRFIELLDSIPVHANVTIDGSKSVYIDRDILEIFQDFRSKAHNKHIHLHMIAIPEVETIEIH